MDYVPKKNSSSTSVKVFDARTYNILPYTHQLMPNVNSISMYDESSYQFLLSDFAGNCSVYSLMNGCNEVQQFGVFVIVWLSCDSLIISKMKWSPLLLWAQQRMSFLAPQSLAVSMWMRINETGRYSIQTSLKSLQSLVDECEVTSLSYTFSSPFLPHSLLERRNWTLSTKSLSSIWHVQDRTRRYSSMFFFR